MPPPEQMDEPRKVPGLGIQHDLSSGKGCPLWLLLMDIMFLCGFRFGRCPRSLHQTGEPLKDPGRGVAARLSVEVRELYLVCHCVRELLQRLLEVQPLQGLKVGHPGNQATQDTKVIPDLLLDPRVPHLRKTKPRPSGTRNGPGVCQLATPGTDGHAGRLWHGIEVKQA